MEELVFSGNGRVVTSIPIPTEILQELRSKAIEQGISVNYFYTNAIRQVFFPDNTYPRAFAAADEKRAREQKEAVEALLQRLHDSMISPEMFCQQLGLDSYQFLALAHLIAGVCLKEEQEVLPASLRLIVEMSRQS